MALWSMDPSSATVTIPMELSMLFAFNAFAPSPLKDGNLILRRLNVSTFAARAICSIKSDYTIRRLRRTSTLRIDRFYQGRVVVAHVSDFRYDLPSRHCVRIRECYHSGVSAASRFHCSFVVLCCARFPPSSNG
jgi:hypothetical protein